MGRPQMIYDISENIKLTSPQQNRSMFTSDPSKKKRQH